LRRNETFPIGCRHVGKFPRADFPTSRQGLGNVRQPGPPNPLKGGFLRGEASFSPFQGVGGSCRVGGWPRNETFPSGWRDLGKFPQADFPRSRQRLGNVRQPGPPNPLKGGFLRGEASFSPYQGPATQGNVSKWLSPRWKISAGRLSKVPLGTWKRPPAWTPKPPERGLFARRSVLLPLSGGRGVLHRNETFPSGWRHVGKFPRADFPTSRQGLGNVRPPGLPNPLKGGFCAAKRPSPPIRGLPRRETFPSGCRHVGKFPRACQGWMGLISQAVGASPGSSRFPW